MHLRVCGLPALQVRQRDGLSAAPLRHGANTGRCACAPARLRGSCGVRARARRHACGALHGGRCG